MYNKTALLSYIKSNKKLHGQRNASLRAATSARKAQSIIEIVLAIGVASMVIAALVILGTISLRTALSSARRAEATRLAISGLEAMRFYRDNSGFSDLDAGCYTINPTTSAITRMNPGGDPNCNNDVSGWTSIDLTESSSQAIFNRKIEVDNYPNGSDPTSPMRKVVTTVRWTESGGGTIGGQANQRAVTMSIVLSNWE